MARLHFFAIDDSYFFCKDNVFSRFLQIFRLLIHMTSTNLPIYLPFFVVDSMKDTQTIITKHPSPNT